MLDLHGEYQLLEAQVRVVVEGVLKSQQFINGPAITELETAIATKVGTSHAVAVSSGTDAILCALMTLGVGNGDEVIIPPFTFFATAGCVARTGATPIFADVLPHTFNLDPANLEAKITAKTKVIIAVHLFGQCAEMDAINKIADRHGITVIEDAAQAIGATYHGRNAGTLGRLACLSFYPTKNLGGFGEGGMILTDDEEIANVARQLRNHGQSSQYFHERIGGNFRLDTMKAAILNVKLGFLDRFTEARRANAAHYDELLGGIPIETPHVDTYQRSIYHQYSILCDRREELAAHLRDNGVATGIYYPVPLHLQPCFAYLGCTRGALPVSERLCERILSLPCHPMLKEDDVKRTAELVHDFYTIHGESGAVRTSSSSQTASL